MSEQMKTIYERPRSWANTITHYCPGCTHGVVHRLVAELVDEFGIQDKTIGVWPVGCAVLGYNYFNFDGVEAAHGRAPAMATGIKVTNPDNFVFAYQGDGDLASIGMAELVHAAARGWPITVIFINNGNYGMTGGQMAPTTLMGQKTTTSPLGRSAQANGYPVRVCEMLSQLDGPAYIARVALDSPANIRKAKGALHKAFNAQIKGIGFSLVEFLSTCPTNWKMTPVEAMERIRKEVVTYYPVGEFKVSQGVL